MVMYLEGSQLVSSLKYYCKCKYNEIPNDKCDEISSCADCVVILMYNNNINQSMIFI